MIYPACVANKLLRPSGDVSPGGRVRSMPISTSEENYVDNINYHISNDFSLQHWQRHCRNNNKVKVIDIA